MQYKILIALLGASIALPVSAATTITGSFNTEAGGLFSKPVYLALYEGTNLIKFTLDKPIEELDLVLSTSYSSSHYDLVNNQFILANNSRSEDAFYFAPSGKSGQFLYKVDRSYTVVQNGIRSNFSYDANLTRLDYYALTDGTVNYTITSQVLSAVPEPSTWAMMIFGMGGVGATLRRRRQQGAGKLAVA
ncbi:MAG: PEPxxWA-CTERM sorting domain-containing protein [Rhizorhabdus sp.]